MPPRRRITPTRLRQFFNPKSVALVGASDNNDMSLQAHRNLLLHGFPGPIYYVNHRAGEVHGQPTVPSLSAIPEPVDLAFVLFGGDRVLDVLEEAALRGTRNFVVLSGGFDEAGDDGSVRQRRMSTLAEEHDLAILGPNTIGFMNLTDGVVLSGAPNPVAVRPGPVGVAVQSGIMLALSVFNLPRRGAGFSVLAAVANEAVITLDQMIDFFVEDEATKVIGLFMETTRDAASFRAAARRALVAGKPIVALATARTEVSIATAVSHTGALVGDQRVREAAFDELGVIMVRSLEEYLTTTALLANYGPPSGRRLAFTSISGGLCELFSDRAVEVGLEMPQFSAETRHRLSQLLPPFAATTNPLDYTGVAQTDPASAAKILDVLTQDPNLDMVVYSTAGDRLTVTKPEDLENSVPLRVAEAVGEVATRSPIPLLPVSPLYEAPSAMQTAVAERTGKGHEIGGSEHGPRAIERAVWWRERRTALLAEPAGAAEAVEIPPVPSAPEAWSEHRVLGLLDSAGVPVVPWALCTSAEVAGEAAEWFGAPVAVKIASPDIAHKSRIGGVSLGLVGAQAVRAAFDRVTDAARTAHPDARIDGVLVMPMRSGGHELIVGVTRDRTWGPVLAVGLGGVWTEALADTALCVLPTTRERIAARLRGLRGAAMFGGGHGLPSVDLQEVARVISRIAATALALGDDLESLEVNPLRVGAEGTEALDGLVTLRRPSDG